MSSFEYGESTADTPGLRAMDPYTLNKVKVGNVLLWLDEKGQCMR